MQEWWAEFLRSWSLWVSFFCLLLLLLLPPPHFWSARKTDQLLVSLLPFFAQLPALPLTDFGGLGLENFLPLVLNIAKWSFV